MELAHTRHPVEDQAHLGQQQGHLLVEPRAAAERDEGPVEVLVRAREVVPPAVGGAWCPSSTARRTAATRAASAASPARTARGLDEPAGPVDVADRLPVRARHEHAAVRLPHQHPLGHKLAHRLAHRVARDPERRAQPLLGQPGSGPQPALDDFFAHRVGDALGRRGPGDLTPGPGEGVDGALARRRDRGRRVERGHEPTVGVLGPRAVTTSSYCRIAGSLNNPYARRTGTRTQESAMTQRDDLPAPSDRGPARPNV